MKKISAAKVIAARTRRVEETALELMRYAEDKPEDRRNLWSWRDSLLIKAREYAAAVRLLARVG